MFTQLHIYNIHTHGWQALDLAKRLRNPVAVAGAIKVANHFGYPWMAQILEDMMNQRLAEAEDTAAEEYGAVSGSDSRSTSEHTTSCSPVVQSYPLLMNDNQYVHYPSTTVTGTSTNLKHGSLLTDIDDDEVHAERNHDDLSTDASATSAIQSVHHSKASKGVAFSASTQNSMGPPVLTIGAVSVKVPSIYLPNTNINIFTFNFSMYTTFFNV